MKTKTILVFLLIGLSNAVLIGQDGNVPSSIFEWAEFLVALISFLIGWFTKQPQQLFKRKK